MAGVKDIIAKASLNSAVRANVGLKTAYERSFSVLPDLSGHYTGVSLSTFFQHKIRFLISAQAAFLSAEVKGVLAKRGNCSLVDIGDSDGSIQSMIRSIVDKNGSLTTIGVNLQPEAVKRIKNKGLEAMCIDAMDLSDKGLSYDVVAVLETLEHLPNPIGFLESIHKVVNDRLVISVPFVRSSRVAIRYLDSGSTVEKATVENVHFFELSPHDWQKIFAHCGWKLKRQWTAFQFGSKSFWRLTAPIWRRLDFEGFWLASLEKDSSVSERYTIE